jgi:hypothetical protein
MSNSDNLAFPTGSAFQDGLSKREYFASEALQGLLGGRRGNWAATEKEAAEWTKEAVMLADALLKALEES